MLKKYFIMAIAAVFTLVACAEKFDEPGILPAGSDNVHTLSVGIEAGTYTPAEGATKASMEAVIRVNWTKDDDEVSVVNATQGKILGGCLKAKESGTSVVFEGTVTGTIEQGDKLYYIYPKLDNTEEIAFDNAGYNQSLANQTYDNETPGKVCFYGYAEDVAGTSTISKKIQFNLVTSYAHLNMSNLPAKGADLSSLDISNVNEGFTWKMSDNTLTAAPYAGSNGISVTCTNCNITQAGNAVARFAIPASAASDEARVVKVNKAYRNEKYIKTELLSSAYYNQLYTSWESNVSITPQTDKTEVSIGNEGSTEVAEGVLPVAEAFVAGNETEIGMGGIGKITFDEAATAKIKSNATDASSTDVFFKVEDVTTTKPVQDANLVYEVTMKTVDEQGVEVFAEGKAAGVATVTVPLGEEVENVTSVALVNESGAVIEDGVVDGSVEFVTETSTLTFKVNHFSKYAIKYTTKAAPVSGYVAQIGSRKYTTLANAVAAAQNGNTIQMIADFATTDEITVAADKNITLDLNGKKISYTADACGSFIENKGQLTVKDSGSDGIITAKFNNTNGSDDCYTINNAGTDENASKLVIESGTIENTSPADLAWPINNGSCGTYADLVINGGTIHSTNYVPVREYLQSGGKKTVVINGGKFISDNSRAIAVQVNDATIADTGSSVTINGGEFTCNGSGILCVDLHAANANMTGFTMTVNGGKFKNSNTSVDVLVYDDEGNTQTSAVLLSKILKGGIYSKEPAPELISFGYHIEANTDSHTSSAYPWRVAANSAEGAEVSISKPGETTVYSTLAAFRDATNAGNTFAGYTVTLLKDIDMAGINDWKAIGDDGNEYNNLDKNFSGIFEGNGKTISNLAISSPNYWGAALFGYVDGTVKNLTISNSSCSGCGGNSILAVMCGGNVTIENCHLVGCNVSTSSSSGLMISYVLSAENAVIKNCSTDENSSITSTGGYQIGGIIGQTTSINTLQLIDCVNRASVTGIYGIGGIIGQFGNNITNATLTRCKNYGAIQLTNYTIQYAGGIAGVIPTTTSSNTNYSFVECENHGTVLAASEWPTFNSCTGGMIGYAYQNAFVTLSMTGCKNTAAVGSDRSIYSGGMIGWHHYAAGTGVFQYTECTNTGAITATQNAQQGNHNAGRAGQLVGCSDNSHDNSTNCVLTGTASANGVTKLSGEEVN